MIPSTEKLLRHIERHAGQRTRELAKHFDVPDDQIDELAALLLRHQIEGSLVRIPHAGWDVPERTEYRVGRLEVSRGGQGFARFAPGTVHEEDIFVRPEDLHGAFPGDAVLLRVGKPVRAKGEGRLREGKVVDVVDRGRRLLRGRFSASSGKWGGRVTLSDKRFTAEVAIPAEETAGAKDGERVLVRLLNLPAPDGRPRGRVIVRLAHEGAYSADLQTIVATFDLPGAHQPEVEAEAAALPGMRPGAEWPNRVDLRRELIFTIDPVDARDFDDAVSLERLKGGEVRLGVHIADVSHYVRVDTKLNAEAEARGTSIYLPGQVIPMLPERLANDLSSLRPAEDRLTKTVRITFSARGEIKQVEVFRSVIRSQRRFTYEEVLAILEFSGKGKASAELPPDYKAYLDVLSDMAALRDKLEHARRKRGALYLDLPKLRLELDSERAVASLGRDARDPSHSLIEEFMLIANEAVASYCVHHKIPLVARLHPPPEEKRLADFKAFVKALGFKIVLGGTQQDFQHLISKTKEDPLSATIQLGLLRTMGHAEYAIGEGEHFALATSQYCHFTSPIRRYPDLLVHQLLDDHFDGKLARATVRRAWDERLPVLAERSSELERRAEEAEREMITLRLIRYLKPRVGEELTGRIVSVHPFGFFVRDETTLVEGLVHVSTLEDDYYELDKENLALVGDRKKRQFKIGAEVRVVLTEADPDQRMISFRLSRSRKGAVR